MNVLIFGATGMVGRGVLRECLLDPDVQILQTVGQTRTGLNHPKLHEIVRSDMLDYAEIETALARLRRLLLLSGRVVNRDVGTRI